MKVIHSVVQRKENIHWPTVHDRNTQSRWKFDTEIVYKYACEHQYLFASNTLRYAKKKIVKYSATIINYTNKMSNRINAETIGYRNDIPTGIKNIH